MAEISEKVQPPRNITSLHFDPPGLVSFKLESEEKREKYTYIYNDLEVAHQHSDFSSTVPRRIGIRRWWLLRRGENRSLPARERTNNKLNPHRVSTGRGVLSPLCQTYTPEIILQGLFNIAYCIPSVVEKLCVSVMGKEPRKVKGAKPLDLQSQTQGNQLTSRRKSHLRREYTDTQQSGHLFKRRKSIRQNLNKNGVSVNGILQVELTLLVYLSVYLLNT